MDVKVEKKGRLKKKMEGYKSFGAKNNEYKKKVRQRKGLVLVEKTERTAVLHIKLAPISRCALRRSLVLWLERDVFFCLLYTCIYEVVGDRSEGP